MNLRAGTRILTGDALAVLRTLQTGSVQTCVTSPPYWGLRDYGTAKWDGGDPRCKHKGQPWRTAANVNANTGTGTDRKNGERFQFYRDTCGKCGARRIDDQIGLEKTPEAYVEKIVAVFREVRRVLKDDGTLWLNLGDSYATGAGKVGKHPGGGAQGANWQGAATQPNRLPIPGLKPKDLVGIPWRVAFALQADGWYLRSDIIWAKPNPMPESVRARPTKAHEYVFLLSKSPRYYYDADAIREPCVDGEYFHGGYNKPGVLRKTATCNGRLEPLKGTHGTMGHDGNGHRMTAKWNNPKGKNKRTVWTVAPRPYKGAHFATFPEKLIEPCILAGAPVGGVVLDPFSGAGTTAIVAERLSRRAIGIELNPEYVELTHQRKTAAAA